MILESLVTINYISYTQRKKGSDTMSMTREAYKQYLETMELTPEQQIASEDKYELRVMVSALKDVQHVRIQIGNKIFALYMQLLGIKPGESKKKLEKEQATILKAFENEYERITDALEDNKNKLSQVIKKRVYLDADGKEVELMYIKNKILFNLSEHWHQGKETEEKIKKDLESKLKEYKIYNEYLSCDPKCRGVGTVISAVIIAYFNIYKAKYPSDFIAFAGLDPVPEIDEKTGEITGYHGRSNKERDLIMREYMTKDGKTDVRKSLTYNPIVKTQLLGVMTGTMFKAHSPYVVAYYNRMMRLNNDPAKKDLTPSHKSAICKRYMVNQFLKDLFVAWKQIEGLPYCMSYEEEFFGLLPHGFEPYDEFMKAHPEFDPDVKKKTAAEKKRQKLLEELAELEREEADDFYEDDLVDY